MKPDSFFQMETIKKEAFSAQTRAYAPYSHFPVGAAVITKTGKIYQGANLENATYGATVCAERNAIAKAVFEKDTEIVAIAIVTPASPPALPCGICLQVLSEFVKECQIVLLNPQGEERQVLFSELFPARFSFHTLGNTTTH